MREHGRQGTACQAVTCLPLHLPPVTSPPHTPCPNPPALPPFCPPDVYQRAMIMDGMAAAAAEIAKPGASLPPLPGLHPAPAPARQLGSAAAQAAADAAAAAAAGLTAEQARLLTTTAHGSRRVGRVTRIASRSLAARQRGTGAPAGRVNRFPPIALKWAAALLRHCDEPQHGIDLLGRDSFLLGKLLVTLGECAGPGEGRRVGVLAITLCLGSASQVHLWWLNTGRAAF